MLFDDLPVVYTPHASHLAVKPQILGVDDLPLWGVFHEQIDLEAAIAASGA